MKWVVGLLFTCGAVLIGLAVYPKFKGNGAPQRVAASIEVSAEKALYILSKIAKVDPKTIPGLHPELVALLDREQCQVPQVDASSLFIQGSFFGSQHQDTAILCLTPEGEMTIKVMGGKNRPCSKSIGYGMIAKYLSSDTSGEPVFFRKIASAPRARLQSLAREHNVVLPKHVGDGIQDLHSTSGSTVYYCNGEAWQSFTASEE